MRVNYHKFVLNVYKTKEVIMVNVNIRMDNELKEQFSDFCSNIGLSMSSLFNVFAKKVVKEKKVPFDLTYNEDPFYSESNMKWLDKATKQFQNVQIVTKTMDELEAIANG
ncbi:MAG: type II toxin-antitoxin system RelB/DinJ family antitoxin [Lachnospiraceae bacterium]|nr:type II toxin-antitoxin system RelB/DinJ family antitoxin [Lachnospiraceae bacterium]